MRAWLPARFATAGSDTHALILLPVSPIGSASSHSNAAGSITAILRRQRRDHALGSFAVDAAGLGALGAAVPERGRPAAIRLRLPAEMLLEREVTLPLVAEQEAERILTYEMDRFTPFPSASVYWTYTVLARDRERAKLNLRLSMVTRSAVQKLMAALNQAGLAPSAIEVPRADAPVCRIALQRPDGGALRRERTMQAGAAGLCATLAVAAAVLPFVLQMRALSQVEAHLEAIRPAVAEADALQHRIATTTAGVDVFAAERARIGDVLTILADVTEKLPDDTYLTDLTLRQGKLTINGQSASAVRLIAALGDAVLRNPEFVAPVNRVDGGRADIFTIRAEVAH